MSSNNFNFVVRHGLVVNGAFTANSTVVNAAAVNAQSVATSSNVTVGSNVTINTSAVSVGNATVNVALRAGSLTINGVNVNTAITGNAATAYSNATAFATEAATTAYSNAVSVAQSGAAQAYSNAITIAANATNITSGTLATARLPATANISTAVNVGNVAVNTTAITISAGNTAIVNASFITVGNTTVNSAVSAGALTINGVNVNTAITGNAATAFTNATTFAANATNLTNGTVPVARLTGTYNIDISGDANNSTNFGGQPASFYTNATNLSTGTVNAARLTGTYSISISGTANNATNLGGQPASFYTNATNISSGTLNSARLSGTYNITAATANNATNLNGQAASYYTDIPSRLGYTPVNKAGDLTMTGNYSTSGSSISVGRGEAGEKQLYFNNSSRQVYFYLAADGSSLGLWDVTGGVYRFSSDTSRNFKVANNVVAEGGIRFADTGAYSASFKFGTESTPAGITAIPILLNDSLTGYIPKSVNVAQFRSTGDWQSPYLEYSDGSTAFGARSFISDANLKKNIQPVERDFIEAIKKIVPSSFDWKEGTPSSGHNSLGLIAQNVMEGIPEGASHVGESTNLSLNPIPLIAALIGAVKQQQKQIDDLKIQIATLQQV